MPTLYVRGNTYDKLISWRERFESQLRRETGKLVSLGWSSLIDELMDMAQKYREAQGE